MRTEALRRTLLLALVALLAVAGLAACSDDLDDRDDAGADDEQSTVDGDTDGEADSDRVDDPDDRDAAAGPVAFGTVLVAGDGDALSGDPVGERAPLISSTSDAGEITIDPADGTPRVLVFLAHWCPHCQAEVPVLVDGADDGVFDDVELVGVLTATNPDAPNFPPSEWLDEEEWPGLRFYDDEDATAGLAYGLDGFPMMVFVDGDGIVQDRLSGEQSIDAVEDAIATITG